MAESKDPVKSWERPWTTDEMRHQSPNWNLAGDAGLLKHLQEFSQNLLAKTHATEVALDSLMEELRATSTDVSNVTNQFLCLANTQFLENRVYDDDEKETPPEEKKEEVKPKSKEEQEAEVVARVRDALTLGMSVLDNMFDRVEVPASDSEDEESSGGRVVLEPRNPYHNRPLPYLIGSRQFMEDDRVGLGSPSDSEDNGADDKNMVQSSESESEMEVEQKATAKKRNRLSSTSASENSDFAATDSSGGGPAPGKQKKVETSGLFGDVAPTETGNMFGGDSPTEEIGDIGARDSFAAQLAAKLGGVAAGSSEQPVPKPRTAAIKPTLDWAEEEDDNDLFGRQDGKFSGGKGLFDDLEDSSGSLWGTTAKQPVDKGPKKSAEGVLFGPDAGNEDDMFSVGAEKFGKSKPLLGVTAPIATSTPETNNGAAVFPGVSNIEKSSLFGTSDVDDGDLFSFPKPTPRDSVQVIANQKTEDSTKKKKPAGAVSIFGSVDVFKAGIRRPPSSSSSGSEDDTVPTLDQAHVASSQDTSSGIGRTSSEHQDSSKSQGESAASKKTSLFSSSDKLFDSTVPSTKSQPSGTEVAATSDLFQDNVSDDSLFSKPQKNVTSGSSKPAVGGNTSSKLLTSRKPMSLFNDSDSGEDELLFSSTSSTSSRSRRSQGSADLLATAGDKSRPSNVQKKSLFDNEDELFSGTKDDPGFDIFGGGSSATSKPSTLPQGGGDLFGDSDPSFNLFKPTGTQDKMKNGLFGADDDDDFDIFGSSSVTKPPKSVPQSLVNNQSNSVKQSSGGLFSSNGPEDVVDDIFAVPVNKQTPSKSNYTDSLFSGEKFLDNGVDDLFGDPIKQKKEIGDKSSVNIFSDQSDDIFAISRTGSNQIPQENKIVSNDIAKSDSTTKTENVANDIFAAVPNENKNSVSSKLFSDLEDSGNDIFGTNVSNSPTNNKPAIASKPVISQKPKPSPAPKPSLLQDIPGESDIFSTSKPNSVKNSPQHFSPIVTKDKSDKVNKQDELSSEKQQKDERNESPPHVGVANAEVNTKDPPVPPGKIEPPKTLNIRKTTGLLFSSSSNEDEDLFGMSFHGKVSLDTSSAEVVDEKSASARNLATNSVPPSENVEKPSSFSTDKRSKSEKEISSKVDPNQGSSSNSTVKARSVGASPRQLNIDPMALLPGAKPPPRGEANAEAAVSFDRPAQTNTTLHSAGKERARIQAKRRPPSRKARQEAVRTSGIDFEGFDSTQPVSVDSDPAPDRSDSLHKSGAWAEATSQPSPSPAKPHPPNFLDGSSNLLSPSTDEEDLFGVPQDLPLEYGNSKDDSENLFTSAPVLSPLEFSSNPLPIISEDGNSEPSSLMDDEVHSTLPETHISTPVHSKSTVNDSDTNDLFSEASKKSNNNDLFSTSDDHESLFSAKPNLKSDTNSYVPDKTVSNNSNMTGPLSENDPLSLSKDTQEEETRDILKSDSQDELFRSGSSKSSSGKVQDLFFTSRSDSGDGDYLFSKTVSNKESKSRTFDSKGITDTDDDALFSSGTKDKDMQPLEQDLFSNSVKEVHSQKLDKSLGSNLFGEDSPESEDLFFSASAKKKVVSKATSSVKGSSLFDEDEGDDIFGSVKSSKSASSTKSSSSIFDNTGSLFSSGVPKTKPQVKTNKLASHSSSQQKLSEVDDLFEDPLMVVTKK